mgnify:CR=1 FL=1
METPGNLFVVAAPSGAGKSSLVKALLELDSHLAVSVSHTTRAPRGQEQQGREYHFIGEPAFRAKIAHGDFFEWAEVHGHLYGTSREAIEARIAGGQELQAGISIVPGSPKPISVRGTGLSAANEKYRQGFLLPPTEALNEPATVIVPTVMRRQPASGPGRSKLRTSTPRAASAGPSLARRKPELV